MPEKTPRELIDELYKPEIIMEKLLGIPLERAEMEKERFRVKLRLENNEAMINHQLEVIANEVASETKDGKPVFPNETKRKAETTRRANENEALMNLRLDGREGRQELNGIEADCKKLSQKFMAYRSLADMFAAVLGGV